MPFTVKQLQEARAPIGAEIRKMADTLGESKPDFTAEERSKWDKLNADFSRMTGQIEVARQAEEVGTALSRSGRSGPTPGLEDTEPRRKKGAGDKRAVRLADEQRAVAFQAWCRRQHGFDLTDAQRRAAKAAGLNPNKRVIEIRLDRRPGVEKRAMSAIDPGAGGYLVPERMKGSIEKALKDFNGLRQVADVMRTDDGATMPWPTNNDTANVGELIGENTAVGNQDEAFGIVNFNAYKYSSKMVKVPSELMDDEAFGLGEFIFDAIGERIGRAQEVSFTNGTGAGQPQGAVTASVMGKTAASSSALAADEIIDLIHSVDPAYRRDPSFRLMFHDNILAVIRKLKDSQNRYLFEEGQGGAPDKIKGVQYVINQNMASAIASGAKTLLAGAFKKFKIRDVKAIRIKKLEERYAEIDQVAFIAFMRSDSRLLNAGTNPIKHLVH